VKVLFFSINNIATPHFETELELMSDHLEKGDEVFVLRCNKNLERCYSNPEHLKSTCFSCGLRFDIGMKRVGISKDNIFGLNEKIKLKDFPESFKNLDELKNFKVYDVRLGFGVFSYLVSELRSHKFDVNAYKTKILKTLRSSILVYESVYEFLKKINVDTVYLFNGRFFDLWPVVKVCEQLNVNYYVYEKGADALRYFLSKNCLPHDLSYVKRDIIQHWDEPNDSKINKYDIGRSLFINKKKREDKVFWITRFDALRSYVKNQTKDLLPLDFDKTKTNIVIFNSSIDEYEAFEEYKNPVYRDDYDSLINILESFKQREDIKFYLRIHPNLKGLDNNQMQELKKLESLGYKNLTTIWPEDKVDSYALLDNCDKSISFISTMLVEATFWGKPAILIGHAFFEGLDCCYRPKSHKEVIELIDAKLEPKRKEEAIKYGYWLITFGIKYKKFKPTQRFMGDFLGRSLWSDIKLKDKLKLKFLIVKDMGVKRALRWQLTKNARKIQDIKSRILN
jgi:hypothetical protein